MRDLSRRAGLLALAVVFVLVALLAGAIQFGVDRLAPTAQPWLDPVIGIAVVAAEIFALGWLVRRTPALQFLLKSSRSSARQSSMSRPQRVLLALVMLVLLVLVQVYL